MTLNYDSNVANYLAIIINRFTRKSVTTNYNVSVVNVPLQYGPLKIRSVRICQAKIYNTHLRVHCYKHYSSQLGWPSGMKTTRTMRLALLYSSTLCWNHPFILINQP